MNRFISGAFVNFVAIVLGVIVSFALTPMLIGHLGEGLYGIWTLALLFSISHGLFAFSDMGVAASIVKIVGEATGQVDVRRVVYTVNSGFALLFLIGLLICAVIFASAGFLAIPVFKVPESIAPNVITLFRLLGVVLLVDLLAVVPAACLQGMQRFSHAKSLHIFYLVLQFLTFLIVIHLDGGLIPLGCGLLFVSFAKLALGVFLLKKFVPSWSFEFSAVSHFPKELIQSSGALLLIRVQASIYRGMDRLLLGAFLLPVVLTDYDVVAKLVVVGVVAVTVVSSMTLAPASSLAGRNMYPELAALFQKTTKYALILSMPVWLLLVFYGDSLITFWVGQDFAPLGSIAAIFGTNIFIVATTASAQNILIGAGRLRFVVFLTSFGTGLNFAISLALVRSLGLTGVIYGTLISGILTSLATTCGVLMILKISTRIYALIVLFHGLAPSFCALVVHWGGAIVLSNPSSILGLSLSVVTYLVIVFTLSLDQSEIKHLRLIFSRNRSC